MQSIIYYLSYLNLVIVSYYHTKNINANQLRERCLRLIHNDKRILLVSIHHKYLRGLAPKLFKICHRMLHGKVSDMFVHMQNWFIGFIFILETTKPHPVFLGTFVWATMTSKRLFFAILDKVRSVLRALAKFLLPVLNYWQRTKSTFEIFHLWSNSYKTWFSIFIKTFHRTYSYKLLIKD